MDDINKNNSGNVDDFEFEAYPDESNFVDNNRSLNNDSMETTKYEGFESYQDTGEEIDVPVLDDSNGNEIPVAEDLPNSENNNENAELPTVPVKKISAEEKARKLAKRERLKKEKQRQEEEKKKKQKNMKLTLLVFGILIFILYICYYALTNMMPEHLMNKGKDLMDAKAYGQAYKNFKMAGNARPYDVEPVYYQALALAQMPPTFENQTALYEISQLDNCDKASEYADAVLLNMKKKIDANIGPNYAGNALYNNTLFRWNQNYPITYYIYNKNGSSMEYINALRKAINNWSRATNGGLKFQELQSGDADIVIILTDALSPSSESEDPGRSGSVAPKIEKDKLEGVNIKLKTKYGNGGQKYDINRFYILAQHEMGHALGVWGHSSDPRDIMYYDGDYISEINPNKVITPRDSNTLSLVYKMLPDAINKPIDAKDKEHLFYHYLITSVPGEDFNLEVQRLLRQTRRDVNDINAWIDLGINYGISKHYKQSNTVFNGILPLARNSSELQFVIFYNMAANYYKLRDYHNAERSLQFATMHRQDIDTEMLSAFIDLKLKRKGTGKAKLILLNNKYPDNVEIAVKLAEVYYFDNEKEESKAVIDNLIKTNQEAIRDKRVMKYHTYNAKAAREKAAKEKRKTQDNEKTEKIYTRQ